VSLSSRYLHSIKINVAEVYESFILKSYFLSNPALINLIGVKTIIK
jgi:hypothetical protein